MKRYAIVRSARTRREAEAYLPDNYKVIHEAVERKEEFAATMPGGKLVASDRLVFVIEGEDRAGWTLDGYVIPRYASGLIQVEEIDLSHPLMKEVPV